MTPAASELDQIDELATAGRGRRHHGEHPVAADQVTLQASDDELATLFLWQHSERLYHRQLTGDRARIADRPQLLLAVVPMYHESPLFADRAATRNADEDVFVVAGRQVVFGGRAVTAEVRGVGGVVRTVAVGRHECRTASYPRQVSRTRRGRVDADPSKHPAKLARVEERLVLHRGHDTQCSAASHQSVVHRSTLPQWAAGIAGVSSTCGQPVGHPDPMWRPCGSPGPRRPSELDLQAMAPAIVCRSNSVLWRVAAAAVGRLGRMGPAATGRAGRYGGSARCR